MKNIKKLRFLFALTFILSLMLNMVDFGNMALDEPQKIVLKV